MSIINKIRRKLAKIFKFLSNQIDVNRVVSEISLLQGGENKVVEIDNLLLLTRKGHTIKFRKNSSDLLVFEQVFIKKEYAELVDAILLNHININTIIDIGSNIGLTSLYLHEYFPNATYVCVEPDNYNFELMKENMAAVPDSILYKNAIWSSEKSIYLNRGFRDQKDWSISASDSMAGAYTEVKSITINSILKENSINIIDLLKIDIEGSEKELFNSKENSSFLNRTKVLAIEIHDEFNIREKITEELLSRKFLLVSSKETLVAINSQLCYTN